jgi:hypothetical protein
VAVRRPQDLLALLVQEVPTMSRPIDEVTIQSARAFTAALVLA